MSLPRTEFKIIDKEYVQRLIFWIEENDESRKAADEKNRENLDVAISTDKEFCAYLSSRISNININFSNKNQNCIIMTCRCCFFARMKFSTIKDIYSGRKI